MIFKWAVKSAGTVFNEYTCFVTCDLQISRLMRHCLLTVYCRQSCVKIIPHVCFYFSTKKLVKCE